MVRVKESLVLWERAKMPAPPDYVWPWSTWVALRREAEEQVPHNMSHLMQHAYARNPVVSCWKVRKIADPRGSFRRRSFIQRRFIPRNYVRLNRNLCPEAVTKERFIMPRFKNIQHKVDDRWDKCPMDRPSTLISRRRSAVSYDPKQSVAIRDILWKKIECGKCPMCLPRPEQHT